MVDGAMSEPNKDEGIGNLFKIIDGIVYQLHRTKRMFIIMILTVMILPPVSLFVASVYLEPPFGGDGHGRPPPPGIGRHHGCCPVCRRCAHNATRISADE